MPITFDVDPSKLPQQLPRNSSIAEHLAHKLIETNAKIVKASNSSDRYINKNATKLRNLFVDHEGQKELVAVGDGCLVSANYDELFTQISDQIDKNTKGDIRSLIECDFSTTTPHTRLVSKIVLMSGMQAYFKYEMYLMCGLPKVTLEGTEDDWKSVRERVRKLGKLGDSTLSDWSKVLDIVLENFVSAFTKPVDTEFWNRITHYTGGGSGPRWIQGWVLAFVAFDEDGKYFLNSPMKIRMSKEYGKMLPANIPTATVSVPVKINDNGTEYHPFLSMLPAMVDNETITPALDWALAVNNPPKDLPFPVEPITLPDENFHDDMEINPRSNKRRRRKWRTLRIGPFTVPWP